MPARAPAHCLLIQNSCGWPRFIAYWQACSRLRTTRLSGVCFKVTRAQEYLFLRLLPRSGASTSSSAGNSSARTNRYVSIFNSREARAAERQITRQQTEGKQKMVPKRFGAMRHYGLAVISPMFATVSPFFMEGTPQI